MNHAAAQVGSEGAENEKGPPTDCLPEARLTMPSDCSNLDKDTASHAACQPG